MTSDAYFRTHEYIFVFAKGKLKTANLLHDKPNVRPGAKKERKPTGRTGDSPITFIPSGGYWRIRGSAAAYGDTEP